MTNTTTTLTNEEALRNMTVSQLNLLLGWLEESPAYTEFCAAIRAEIARQQSVN